MKWTDEEVYLVALAYACGLDAKQVKEAHEKRFGDTRTLVALANAKTQRVDVRELIAEFEDSLGLNGITPDHPELRELERKLTVKEQKVRDLQQKLKAADKDADLFYNLAEEIREHVHPWEPRKPKLLPKEKGKDGVSMVALLSDCHGDAIVHPSSSWGLETFDFNIFRARMQRWAQLHIDYITRHRPNYLIEELWVLSLGDNIHGDIHDHRFRNFFGNSIVAAMCVGDVIAEALLAIHTETGVPIRYVGISGNHPRRSARKDFDGPTDNFDYLVNVNAAQRLRETPDIDIVAPNSWTAFVSIRGDLWALNHGDGAKGYAGFPWYGFDRINNRIQSVLAQTDKRVRYFVYGHYHTPALHTNGNHMSWHNGAFPATDPFALEAVQGVKDPMQWSFLVNDNHGLIDVLPMWLRDREKEQGVIEGTERLWIGQEMATDLVEPEYEGERLNIIV